MLVLICGVVQCNSIVRPQVAKYLKSTKVATQNLFFLSLIHIYIQDN